MRQMARVTMSMRELDRLKCVQAVVDGDLYPYEAAERLGITTRRLHGWSSAIAPKALLESFPSAVIGPVTTASTRTRGARMVPHS